VKQNFANGIAAVSASGYCGKTKVAAGIVGHADLTLGRRVEPVLAAACSCWWRSIPRNSLYHIGTPILPSIIQVIPPPGLLGDKTFREGFRVLSRLGLSFDTLVFHPQLDDVANLARSFPDTKIVLNHVGRPVGTGAYTGKLNEVFPRWSASIKALAAHENLYIKVGGLGQSINAGQFNTTLC
jgi:L-fuconolactonase